MKLGRFGFRIGTRNTGNVIETNEVGRWKMFFPGCWWQVKKPWDEAAIHAIWEADAEKFLPQCILDKGYITKADLEWKGLKCDWGIYDKVHSRCWTCSEVKNTLTGKITQKGANTWRKENEDNKELP